MVESLENDNQNGGSSGTTNSGNGNNQNGGSSGTTNTGGSNNQNNSNIGTTNSGTSGKTDSTTTTGSLPKTGVSIVLITSIFLLIGISILTYNKYKKFKGI